MSSSSFPSGHSADGALTYLLLACLAGPIVTVQAARCVVVALALLLVLLVGMSRLYLGVHWPTDVLGGWCFGAIWAPVASRFVRTGSWRAPDPAPVEDIDASRISDDRSA